MSGLFPPPDDLPTEWVYEHEAHSVGYSIIAGIDEVGRGPLAGPVVAAAVVLPFGVKVSEVTDSKKVSEKKRPQLADRIIQTAEAFSIGVATCGEIDRLNILQATFLAMRRAVSSLSPPPEFLLIDGDKIIPDITTHQRAVVKGDSKSISISAASILAKVARDRMMDTIDKVFPDYGFKDHKGYGTARHLESLRKHGPCHVHRRTFKGVKELLVV